MILLLSELFCHAAKAGSFSANFGKKLEILK